MLQRSEAFFAVIFIFLIIHQFECQESHDDDVDVVENDSSSLKGETVGGNFQGDMILSKQQIRNLNFSPRNGLIYKRYRWPKNEEKNVVVTYGFKDKNEFSSKQKAKIRSALDEIESSTCVRFVEDESDPKHIQIFSGQGCYSDVGRQPSKQNILSLKKGGCELKGTIMHEFLHALGFFHMQSSHDREKYIRIKFENVNKEFVQNFKQYSNELISHFGTSYDVDSIMHYKKKSFSKNGKDTIETIDPSLNNRIGQRAKLSPGDIKRINNMYKCGNKTSTKK